MGAAGGGIITGSVLLVCAANNEKLNMITSKLNIEYMLSSTIVTCAKIHIHCVTQKLSVPAWSTLTDRNVRRNITKKENRLHE